MNRENDGRPAATDATLALDPARVVDDLEPTLEPLRRRYQISALLGAGGMGKVYRARDRETNEVVALKVLRPDIAADPSMAERFKNELRLARRITHKNVCRIYDFNRIGELAFITMEYVEGESLRAYLRRLAPLPLKLARDLMLQIGAGLGEAHAQGVVHRDLKPENIMIGRDAVKVMDFGIARSLQSQATTTTAFLGTPAYVAPEQAQGRPVDQRADIYALGLIFYECLTGRAAFSGDTPIEVALKQVNEVPLAPRRLVATVPVHIEAMILRCLEKNPERRFTSVDQWHRALMMDTAVHVSTARPRAAPTKRAHGGRWLVVALVCVIAIGVWQLRRPAPRPVVAIDAPPVVATVASPTPAAPPAPVQTVAPVPPQSEPAAPRQQLLAAAQAGDLQAQYRLAHLLAFGPADSRDRDQAVQWMRRAAHGGHAEAQFALAKMYEHGRGVARSVASAKSWYERAAAGGHAQAQAALARAGASRGRDAAGDGPRRPRRQP